MPRSPLRDPNEEDSDDEDPQERLQTRSEGYDRSRSDRDYGAYDATRAAYEMQRRCGCTDGDITNFCSNIASPCVATETKLCGAARAVSAASCRGCAIAHITQFAAAKCTDGDITTFCNHSTSPCIVAETRFCGAARASPTQCAACAASHLMELSAAHCTSIDIDDF